MKRFKKTVDATVDGAVDRTTTRMTDKVKTHFRENKKVYLAFAGGALLVYVANGRRDVSVGMQANPKQILNWKPRAEVNQINIEMVERSTPSKPVHLKGTNLYFNSLSEAARETGHPLSTISKQINGHIPDVKGDVFEILESAS